MATPVAEGRILQAGRAKAYRPLPLGSRRRAVRAGIAAYRRGDFFEAHELLEPAWMGTQDLAEREALQGLIKLAAAYVHAVRGNPRGVVKNLDGAEARLRRALADGSAPDVGIDIAALVEAIDARRGALPRTAAPSDGRRSDPALAPVILAAVPPPDLVPVR